MGFLEWRVWDRLDALDRRVGIKPITPERRRGLGVVVLATLLTLAMLDFIERDWAGGLFALGVAVVGTGAVYVASRASRRATRR